MKVNGYEVPAAVEDACIERMKQGEFRAADIEKAAKDAGCPETMKVQGHYHPFMIAHRVADRIIQRERMAGRIKMSRYPKWIWAGPAGR